MFGQVRQVGVHYAKSWLTKLEQATGVATDPSDMLNEIIYSVRKVNHQAPQLPKNIKRASICPYLSSIVCCVVTALWQISPQKNISSGACSDLSGF